MGNQTSVVGTYSSRVPIAISDDWQMIKEEQTVPEQNPEDSIEISQETDPIKKLCYPKPLHETDIHIEDFWIRG